MRDGVIQQIADPDAMFSKPANLFVAGFIGSPGMNFMRAEARGGTVSLFGHAVPVPGAPSGGEVIAGVRPEHLTLGQGKASFVVRPTLVESLGSEKYVYFDPGDHALGDTMRDEHRGKGLIARLAHAGPVAEGEDSHSLFRSGGTAPLRRKDRESDQLK